MQRSQVRQSERGLDRPCWLCRLREGAVCPGSRRDPAGCADAERAPCAWGAGETLLAVQMQRGRRVPRGAGGLRMGEGAMESVFPLETLGRSASCQPLGLTPWSVWEL